MQFLKQQIKKIKGWDEKLFGGTDTDLFEILKKNNFEILKVKPLLLTLQHQEG